MRVLGRRRVAPVARRRRRWRPVRVLAVVGVVLGQRLLRRLALAVLLVVGVPDGLVAPGVGAAAVGRVHRGAVRVLVGGAGHELERLPVGAEVLNLSYGLRCRRNLKD